MRLSVVPMVTFKVVKERHGWAVRMGEQMTTPFWSRGLAVREADCIAAGIRRHGVVVEVLIEELVSLETVGPENATLASGAEALAHRRPAARQ
jgi:hypothetical protein